MKNLILVTLLTIPMLGFGQTKIKVRHFDDGKVAFEKEAERVVVKESEFTADDKLSDKENRRVYLAQGDTVNFGNSEEEVGTYSGLERVVELTKTKGYLDSYGDVKTFVSPPEAGTQFAWELILTLAFFFSFSVIFQKSIKEEKLQVKMLVLFGLFATIASIVISLYSGHLKVFGSLVIFYYFPTYLICLYADYKKNVASLKMVWKIFSVGYIIFSAITGFLIFPGTEEFMYAVVLGVVLGKVLTAGYYWLRKIKQTENLSWEEDLDLGI